MGGGKMQGSTTVVVLMVLVAIYVVAIPSVEAADQTSLDAKGPSRGRACCDMCLCTKSIPPQCRCSDVKETCKKLKGCKSCVCRGSSSPHAGSSSPPHQCQCTDIQNFCYPKCKGAAKEFQN